MAREKILIVDDEIEILDLIKSCLMEDQYQILTAQNAKNALESIETEAPDLILLDIMLPDIDGIELCLEIRKLTNAPILFISCKSQEMDKVLALSVGGDDFITKPFLPNELLARIKAHLRRSRLSQQTAYTPCIIEYPGIQVNIDSHEVFVDNELVVLSAKEFEILEILIKNPKRIYSMKQLFQMVWKMDSLDNDARTIMVYISNLRKKIEKNPSNPQYIVNVRGVGYKFNSTVYDER
ncbi:MAG: response regulator transcription factor [Clostridia bacterium]|nr:response regulator transcription factor [Clostridia bacterium]